MLNELEEFKNTSQTLKEAASADTKRPVLTQTYLFILSYIAMTLILALVTFLVVDDVPVDNDVNMLKTLGVFIVPIFVTIFFVTKLEKRSLRSLGFSRDNILSSLLKGLALGFGMFILVVVIGMLLGQYRFEGFDPSSLYLAIPYMIAFIIQPFAEEIYSRGWIIPLFAKNYSVLVAILVSTLFFTWAHIYNDGINLVALINIALFGVLLSILFLKTDNIWACGGLHCAWNYTQGYLLGFNVSGMDTSSLLHFNQVTDNLIGGGIFGPESGLITTFVLVLAFIFIWKADL